MVLEKVDAKRAEDRMKAGVRANPVDEPSLGLEEKGRTRDTVAKKVGLKSGRQYDRAKSMILH